MKETLMKAINVAEEELSALKEYHDDTVIEKSDKILAQVIAYLKNRLAGEILSNTFKCYSSPYGAWITLAGKPTKLVLMNSSETLQGMYYCFKILYNYRNAGYNAQKFLEIYLFYDLESKTWKDQTSHSEILKVLSTNAFDISDTIIDHWDSFKKALEVSIKKDYEDRIAAIKKKAEKYAADLDKLDSFSV